MTDTMRPPARFDSRRYRDALASYASGVTVITGLHEGEPVGFTCQSFYSVSLEPPLVSFSVMTTSTTYPRIRESTRFAVNVLAGGQHGLSDQFARRGTDKWAGVEWTASGEGTPLIDGTLLWLECELWSEHLAGDHLIVVGRVHGIGPEQPASHAPLLYFQGGYRTLDGLPPAAGSASEATHVL